MEPKKKLADLFKKKEEVMEDVKAPVATPTPTTGKKKFIVISTYGEILDLCMYLKYVEGHEVIMSVPDKEYKSIGNGIIEKFDHWFDYIGKGYIWIIDGCENSHLQDHMRQHGEPVCGSDDMMAEYENDRQKGQKWFKEAGFYQPESYNFKDIDSAIQFIEDHKDQEWILKQNGDAPKFINHKGKFPGNEDMLFHLNELKVKWNTQEFGPFDCDFMEVVKGFEVAVSAFWNGHDYLRNKEGKVVAFHNHEHKKECDGNLGETTGEMGTTFIGVDETDQFVKDVILNPVIVKKLKESNFHGVFDINCIVSSKGIVALEPTSRFGIPATSYEFMEGLLTPTGDLIEALAKGLDTPIEIHKGWGIVLVIAARPYPVDHESAEITNDATSLGEKLWLIQNGKPIKELTPEQRHHIHLENFEKTDEGDYKVATKSGYLLTVTWKGATLKEVQEKSKQYIHDNMYISGMKFRQDIGEGLEEWMK